MCDQKNIIKFDVCFIFLFTFYLWGYTNNIPFRVKSGLILSTNQLQSDEPTL